MRIAAVDPDHEKSGVAVVDTESRTVVYAAALTFGEMYAFLRDTRVSSLYVEASWVYSHNWHAGAYGTPARAAAIGRSVGLNHQTGMDIVSLAKAMKQNINVYEVAPLRKCWAGRDKKITAREIELLTGYAERSNQEVRDAILLAWVCSGIALKINTLNQK